MTIGQYYEALVAERAQQLARPWLIRRWRGAKTVIAQRLKATTSDEELDEKHRGAARADTSITGSLDAEDDGAC